MTHMSTITERNDSSRRASQQANKAASQEASSLRWVPFFFLLNGYVGLSVLSFFSNMYRLPFVVLSVSFYRTVTDNNNCAAR